MRRHALISVLCLSLASLAPVPLSACAMLMAPDAGCAPSTTVTSAHESHCEQAMSAEETKQTTLRAGASKLSCCDWTAAVTPDASAGSGKVSVSPAALATEYELQVSVVKAIEQSSAPSEQEQFASPPDRQSLLSVFLI